MSKKSNSIANLNEHLFKQLDRLADPENDIETEIARSKAITDVSQEIVASGHLELKAQALLLEHAPKSHKLPSSTPTKQTNSVTKPASNVVAISDLLLPVESGPHNMSLGAPQLDAEAHQ